MLRIVGIVVDRGHRAQLVVALHEHTLVVEVGESERTHYALQPPLAAPILYLLKQPAAHLDLVGEVYESEPDVFRPVLLVECIVDDACDAAYRFSVSVGHEAAHVAEVEGRVFLRVEGVDVVAHQRRHEIRIVLIHVDLQLHELLQFLRRQLYFLYLNHFFSVVVFSLVSRILKT